MDTVPVVSPLRQTDIEVAPGAFSDPPKVESASFTVVPGLAATDTETGLGLTIELNVVHSPRAICPVCGNRRVLWRVAAWVKGQFAGAGAAKCAKCAGFRMAGAR